MGAFLDLDESLDGSSAAPRGDQRIRLIPRSSSIATGWLIGLSSWVLLGLIQLPAAAGLIELEGLKRGSPINGNDHFSELPELEMAFDTANLGGQHLFGWIILMTLFAVSGLVIAFGSYLRGAALSFRMSAAMAALWVFGAAVGFAHRETLDLVMWLTN